MDTVQDDSDVTLNVCLGREFQGATLTFCHPITDVSHRRLGVTYRHLKGHAVIHAGRHRHGADDIQNGERVNFLLWSLNSAYRSDPAFQRDRTRAADAKPPSKLCLSYTHDADFAQHLIPLSDEEAIKRGVMLHQIQQRAKKAMALQDLSRPNETINTQPSLCVFVENCDDRVRKKLATALVLLAEKEGLDQHHDVGDKRPLACYLAVVDGGTVQQVRQMTGLSTTQSVGEIANTPAAVILDVPRARYHVLSDSGDMTEETLTNFVRCFRAGQLKTHKLG